MMLNTALPVAAALPGTATPAHNGAPVDDAAGFAQALDQAEARQRDAAGADAAAPAVDKKAPARGDKAAARTARLAIDAALGAVATPGTAGTAGVAPDESPAAAPSADDNVAPAEPAADAPMPSELAAWLSALPLPRPAPGAPAAATTAEKPSLPATAVVAGLAHAAVTAIGTSANTETSAGIEQPAVGARGSETATTLLPMARGAARGTASPAAVAGAAAIPQLPAIEAVLRANGLARETAATGAAESLPLIQPPGLALVQGAAQRPGEIAAPPQIELREAVDSKAFAPSLGATLSVLVRNGIEQAQLQLHPAELGPIDVRIRVDGHEAQVDFGAAHATTRQALQDAVPALAGALRDSGLTLTGGGVFEQARDPRSQAQPQTARGQTGAAADEGGAALQAPAARGARARGVVDLYA